MPNLIGTDPKLIRIYFFRLTVVAPVPAVVDTA